MDEKKSTLSEEKDMIEEERLILEDVDDRKGTGEHTSIDISDEHRYIAYHSSEDGSLRLARNGLHSGAEDWEVWTVDDGECGEYSSMQVEKRGDETIKAHIAYYDSSEKRLRYALWSESDENVIIETETVDSGGVGKDASLTLDDSGTPHISYHDEEIGALMYAKASQSSWNSEEVMTGKGEGVGLYSSIDLDSDDEPKIAHHGWYNTDLIYSYRGDDGWSNEFIDAENLRIGRHASLVLDKDDHPHISCYEWTNEDYSLKYITNVDGTWKIEEVDPQTDFVGTHTSIDLTGEGKPVISYHRWDEENLRLAWREKEGGWTIKEVDSTDRVGTHTSLKIGDMGMEAHLSYHDKTNEDLLYGRILLENRTPFPPQNFETHSKYGDVILEWDEPIFDGLYSEKDGIDGYNIYRKREGLGGFELLEENHTSPSNTYKDQISEDNETEDHLYKITAVNRKGEGEKSTVLRTRAKYFEYEMTGAKTNSYEIKEFFPFVEEDEEPNKEEFEIRWDLAYNESEGTQWDSKRTGAIDVTEKYEDVGLKSVMLELEYQGVKRRSLQSAWVLGRYGLTSTYEIEDSNEVFFHIPDDLLPILSDENELKNTYVFKGHEDLPYRAINFTSPSLENQSIGDNDLTERPKIDHTEEDVAFWNRTMKVSDAEKDCEVKAEPLLYNEHRNSYENPFDSDQDETIYDNEKEVNIMDMPDWAYHMMEHSGELTIENERDEERYTGWELEYEPDVQADEALDMINISSILDSNINKLADFFGGAYGFELEAWPDQELIIDNENTVETRLLSFTTDVAEDHMGSGEFKSDFGNTLDYSGESEIGTSINLHLDMIVDPNDLEIKTEGSLELEFESEISIDIPLKSIGIGEAGLTAGIESGMEVEFEIGSLSYDHGEERVNPELPDGDVPIDMEIEFGGGPYAEAGAGLARIEGKLICELDIGIEIPSMERGLDLNGEFEVTAEALWGLWERSESWPLFSVDIDSDIVQRTRDIEDMKKREVFSTDRLFTRQDGVSDEFETELEDNTPEGVVRLGDYVSPDSDPEIAFLNDEAGMAVWSEISTSNSDATSDLHTRVYDEDGWGERSVIQDVPASVYDPQLMKRNGEEMIIFYMGVDEKIGEETCSEDFFEKSSIKARTWSPTEGWSSPILNYSYEDGPINNYDVCLNDEEFHISYRGGEVGFDIFETGSTTEGTIGLIRGDFSQENRGVEEVWHTEERMSATSSPSVISNNENIALSFIRNVEFEDGGEEDCYNETVIVDIEASNDHLKESEMYIVRETVDTISEVVLSKHEDDLAVSWIEDHSSLKRAEVETDGQRVWTVLENETVFSGRTISCLSFHENDTGKFYTFQTGETATPMIIENKGDGWGYLRYISIEDEYSHGELDNDFSIEEPRMIYVEKEEVIEKWQAAHYDFNRVDSNKVSDESKNENTALLKENYSIKDHDGEMRTHGNYAGFEGSSEGSSGMMRVPSCSSLNVTDDSEEFSLSSLIKLKDDPVEGELFQKNGSWQVSFEEDELSVKLWNDDTRTVTTHAEDVEFDEWFFIGVRYERVDEKLSYLNITLANRDVNISSDEDLWNYTDSFKLKEMEPLNSSSSPLKIAEYLESIVLDDFRLFQNYLPDASIIEIFSTPFPDFDRRRKVTTQSVPPYVNFSYSESPVLGEETSFYGSSTSTDLNWTWIFGEEKRYGQNVEYVFEEVGHHDVILKVTHNQTGARAYQEEKINVKDVNPPDFEGISEYTILSNNSVELEWNVAEDFSKPITYRVHVAKEVEDFDHSNWRKSTKNDSIVLRDLEPRSEHRIKVTAVNSLGLENNETDVKTIELEDERPPEFDGLRSLYVSDHSEKRVSLEWLPATDHSEPITYNIYHVEEGDMCFEDTIETTEETWADISVEEIGEHKFAVRAEDREGNEDKNEVIRNIEVKDTDPPSLEIIRPKEGSEVTSNVFLQWYAEDEYSGISHYKVKSDIREEWLYLASSSSVMNHTFDPLTDGEHTLTVKAIDNAGNQVEDSVEVSVVASQQSPTVQLFSPEKGETDVSPDTTLQVEAFNDGKSPMEVRFYREDGDLLGKDNEVESGDAASIKVEDLSLGETYRWYVEVEDKSDKTTSRAWSFETVQKQIGPENPYDPSPEDGFEFASSSQELSVNVSHADNKVMDVIFYCANDDNEIGKVEGIESGERAIVTWDELEYGERYDWYAVADDGENSAKSDTWNFGTYPLNEKIEVKTLDVDPIYSEAGRSVSITAEIENDLSTYQKVELEIKDEEGYQIRSWEEVLEGDETTTIEKNHQFSDEGVFIVNIGEDEEKVRIVDEMTIEPKSLDISENIYRMEPALIEAVLMNQEEKSHEVYLYINEEKMHSENIPAEIVEHELSFEHHFKESGEKVIEIRDENYHVLFRESIDVLDARPSPPEDPKPKDGAQNVSTAPTLSVNITHPENKEMEVSFYRSDKNDREHIESVKNISSDEIVSIDWGELEKDTDYEWYVVVEDKEENKISSDTWNFTTEEEKEDGEGGLSLQQIIQIILLMIFVISLSTTYILWYRDSKDEVENDSEKDIKEEKKEDEHEDDK